MADLNQSSTADLRTILEIVFNRTTEWWNSQETKERYRKILDDAIFKRKLEGYTDYVIREEDRYKPFCELANHIVSLLRPGQKDLPLVVRNDRVKILGSAATRYPDCVIVRPISLEDSRRGSPEKLAKKGPTLLPFSWQELLTFVEFKMEETYLGKILEDDFKILQVTGGQNDKGMLLMDAAPITSNGTKDGTKGAKPTKRRPGDSPISPKEQRKRPKTRFQTETEQAPQAPLGSHSTSGGSYESEGVEHANSEASEDQDDGSDYQPGRKLAKKGGPKQKEPKVPINYALQCASYALELLSNTSPSTHRLGFLVNDDKIQIQYYDRSRIVVSPEVSFVRNPGVLIEILDCLVSATPRQWGFLEAIIHPEPVPSSYTPEQARTLYLSGTTFKCENNAVLSMGAILFRQHAIIGRGTCVVRATSQFLSWQGRSLVVKITFTPATRPPESKYLTEILCRAREDKGADVLDHFPEMLLSQGFHSTAMEIQDRFRKYFESSRKEEKVLYEMRNIQFLVMAELRPVKELKEGDDVKEVLAGVVKGYIWLYRSMKLLHRDISVDNIMYRYKDGKIRGVLNDFDLAIYTTEQLNSPLSKQRTGTRPFMTKDLLASSPTTHLYRHDLESFMYVTMVLACFRHASPDEQKESPIAAWFNPKATEVEMRFAKIGFLSCPNPIPTSKMTCLSKIVKHLLILYREEQTMSNNILSGVDGIDLETLGGVITFEKFGKIFGLNM